MRTVLAARLRSHSAMRDLAAEAVAVGFMCVVKQEAAMSGDELVERGALGRRGLHRVASAEAADRIDARSSPGTGSPATSVRNQRGAQVAGQLGMEAESDDAPRAHPDRLGSSLRVAAAREHLDPSTDARMRGARMNTPGNARPSGCHFDVGDERVDLATVRVALDRDVEHAERRRRQPVGRACEQDHARAGAEHRPLAHESLERCAQPGGLEQAQHGRRLAAGQHQCVEPLEVARAASRAPASTPSASSVARVAGEVALQAQHTDARHATSPAALRELLLARDRFHRQAAHRLRQPLARLGEHVGSVVVGDGLDDGLAPCAAGCAAPRPV